MFVNVDVLTYAWDLSNIQVTDEKNYAHVKANINDIDVMRAVYERFQPTDCIHFAAESHVDNSIENPNIFLETNVMWTNNLLLLHREFWLDRFHYVSTDEVYGDLPLDRPDLKFTLETPLHPHSPYSVSKAWWDMLVQAFYRTYGLDVTTSRCSNNYGPYQHAEKLIPRSIWLLQHNEPIQIYGTWENVRDRIHVEDHNAWVRAIFTKAESGAVYNLGWDSEKTNNDIAHLLCTYMWKDTDSSIIYVKDRLGHDRRYAIDYTQTTKDLWWEPKIAFEQGMKETVEWYKRR